MSFRVFLFRFICCDAVYKIRAADWRYFWNENILLFNSPLDFFPFIPHCSLFENKSFSDFFLNQQININELFIRCLDCGRFVMRSLIHLFWMTRLFFMRGFLCRRCGWFLFWLFANFISCRRAEWNWNIYAIHIFLGSTYLLPKSNDTYEQHTPIHDNNNILCLALLHAVCESFRKGRNVIIISYSILYTYNNNLWFVHFSL